MKKLLIPFVASFGLSLGIATGVVLVRTPKTAPLHAVAKVAEVTPKVDSAVPAKNTATVPAPESADAAAVGQTGNATASATAAAPADGHKGEGVTPAIARTAAIVQPVLASKQPLPVVSPSANAKAGSTPSATAKPALPASKTASDSLIGRKLAQVFGAMQAKDAARVLAQMDDTDVRAILGSLSSKQQAAILGSFPTQRAAVILQATLRTVSSGGAK